MKYLFFTLLFIFCSAPLSAQDTIYLKKSREPLLVDVTVVNKNKINYKKRGSGLGTVRVKNVRNIQFQKKNKPVYVAAFDTLYLKGQKEPLLVNLKLVKKKSLNYTRSKGGGLRTVRLEDVKEIRHGRQISFSQFEQSLSSRKRAVVAMKKDEFRSSVLLQLSALSGQSQLGLAYMHRLSPATTKQLTYWVKGGVGLHWQDIARRDAQGHYLEFGGIVELKSKSNPKSRFHIGYDLNLQLAKVTEPVFSGRSIRAERNERRIVLQVPVGYTFRGDNGFYISAGFEMTRVTDFALIFDFKLGYSFGK